MLKQTVRRGALAGALGLVVLSWGVKAWAVSAGDDSGPVRGGGEAALKLPDLSQVSFLGGISGDKLLMSGLGVCLLGLLFGLVIYKQLQRLPVHSSMQEISTLIWETCKTYLITQGKFILLLEAFIGVILVVYFGVLMGESAARVVVILLFSLVGIAGSYGVASF